MVRRPTKTSMCVLMLLVAVPAAADARDQSQRRSADYDRTVREGTTLGGVLGAGIGAAIGSRNGTGGAVSGALIGGVIGGVLGNVGGTSVAKGKSRQIVREDRLDARIASARASNRQLSSLASASGKLASRRERELAALKRSGADTARKRQLLADLRADRASIDEALASARKSRSTLQSDIGNYRTASALRSEMGKTDGAISRLKADRARYDRMIGEVR